METTSAIRVVIDTDAGVDDALAIVMAMVGFPREAVIGITTVFGNADLQQVNHNVAYILEAMDRTDIPIHSGASGPIISSVSEKRWEGHGPDGLGGEAGVIQRTSSSMHKNQAVHALIDLARQYAGELVVIALGPLTNIALAMLLDPGIASNLKQLVVMGGQWKGQGNLTPWCEFNVGCDPEATQIVYQHSTASLLVVVPLETCRDNALPWKIFDEVFGASKTRAGALIGRVWKFTKAFCGRIDFTPYDAYAVATLLHSDYTKNAQKLRGCIHLAQDEQRGANEWEEVDSDNANATLITEINRSAFIQLLRKIGEDPSH